MIQAPEEWNLEPIDWIIASKTYTKLVIEKCELLMGEGNPNYQFSQYKTPMDKDYYPELDDSPFLNAEIM